MFKELQNKLFNLLNEVNLKEIFKGAFFLVIFLILYGVVNPSKEIGELFFIIWLILFLIYCFIFNLEKTEQFLLRKITWLLIIAGILIIKSQNYLGIENKDIFYMIGAIFAFWYGYKRYEREKELENIENVSKKIPDNLRQVIFQWVSHKKLHDKGYLEKYTYSFIENLYINEINEKYADSHILLEEFKIYGKEGIFFIEKIIGSFNKDIETDKLLDELLNDLESSDNQMQEVNSGDQIENDSEVVEILDDLLEDLDIDDLDFSRSQSKSELVISLETYINKLTK